MRCVFDNVYTCYCWSCGDEFAADHPDAHFCWQCVNPSRLWTDSWTYTPRNEPYTVSVVLERGAFRIVYD